MSPPNHNKAGKYFMKSYDPKLHRLLDDVVVSDGPTDDCDEAAVNGWHLSVSVNNEDTKWKF